jgi:hypothetical protein
MRFWQCVSTSSTLEGCVRMARQYPSVSQSECQNPSMVYDVSLRVRLTSTPVPRYIFSHSSTIVLVLEYWTKTVQHVHAAFMILQYSSTGTALYCSVPQEVKMGSTIKTNTPVHVLD